MVQEISCGESHWLVLERHDIKPLEKWNENDVQEWFKSMKMDEFLNIIKYEKINGKDIFNGDETFFVNVMGMPDDQIKKVKYEIKRVKYVTCRLTKLWGWGSNKMGQLGQMNLKDTFVKTPTLINLPEMKEIGDYIIKAYCGKTFTVLITKFGEIYITGNYPVKDKEKLIPQQNLNNVNFSGGKKNKIVEKNKTSQLNLNTCHRWVNITKEICFDMFCNK